MNYYPKKYKITSGAGKANHELVSFDLALIDAEISNYNLLRVSSILPIECQPSEEIDLKEGSSLLTAYGTECEAFTADISILDCEDELKALTNVYQFWVDFYRKKYLNGNV